MLSSPGRPIPRSPDLQVRRYWLPRVIRPTRGGIWFLIAALALGLAATNTGNNLLYLILAMLLSLLMISGLLSEQTLRRVRLSRRLPQRIFAGTPAVFQVSVRNHKRRVASYALHVHEADPGGAGIVRRFLLRLGPQETVRWEYTLVCPRRGRHRLPGLVLSTRFPFGLFEKMSRPLLQEAILVYPQLRALRPGDVPHAHDHGFRERTRRGPGVDLHNLRAYRAGDDPRHIHWATSARTGELVLKEHAVEERPRLHLVLEDPPRGWIDDRVEADLSLAASLAAQTVRRGTAVALTTAGGSTGFGEGERHLTAILERLALYEAPAAPRRLALPADGAPAVRLVLGAGGPRASSGGIV